MIVILLLSITAIKQKNETDYGKIVLEGTVNHHIYPRLSWDGVKQKSEYRINLIIKNQGNAAVSFNRAEITFYSPKGKLSAFHMGYCPANDMGEYYTAAIQPFSDGPDISFLTGDHTEDLIKDADGKDIAVKVKLFNNEKTVGSFNTTLPTIKDKTDKNGTISAELKTGESKRIIFTRA